MPHHTPRLAVLGLAFLTLTPFSSAPADAQTPPTSTFTNLRTHVRPGDLIIVHSKDGRTTRGRFAAVADGHLEVQTRGFFRVRVQVLDESSVGRIEVRDSTANGILIGLGIGAGIALAGCRAHRGPDDFGCLKYLAAPALGAGFGELADNAINRPIFVAPGGATASVAPLVSPGRVGLAARLSF